MISNSAHSSVPFNSFDEVLDLIQLGRLRLVQVKGQDFMLLNSPNHCIAKILQEHSPKIFNSTEDARKLVQNDRRAVYSDHNTNLNFLVGYYGICHVTVIEDSPGEQQFLMLLFRKDFVYLEQTRRATAALAGSE